MPFCPKCGKPTTPKSSFCVFCGSNLPLEIIQPGAPTSVPPPPLPEDPFKELAPPATPGDKTAIPDEPFPIEPIPTIQPFTLDSDLPPAPVPIEQIYTPPPAPPRYVPPPSPPVYQPPPVPVPPRPVEPVNQAPASSYSPPPWRTPESTYTEPTRQTPRYEDPYRTKAHSYNDYDMPKKRGNTGLIVFLFLLVVGGLAALYFGGVFNTTPSSNPEEEYNKVYESAVAAIQSKNPAALFPLLSNSSRTNLAGLIPKERSLDSSLDDKSDASTLLKSALERNGFDTLFPAGDSPASFKEMEGKRIVLTTQQGKKFVLVKEDGAWKLELDPGAYGFDQRRYTVLDSWNVVLEKIKTKDGAGLYDSLTKASKAKAEEEAKLPAYTPTKPGQQPKPRPTTGPGAFKDGKELFTKSLAESKDLPDVTSLKVQKMTIKDNRARIYLTNSNVVEFAEENTFWKLDLLNEGGPPTALLGTVALIATGKAAPVPSATGITPDKPTDQQEGEGESGRGAGGRYTISGNASVSGDSGLGRTPGAVVDKINSNFNNRVQLGLISASPSKAGVATATFTIGKDGSVYGVSVSCSNGDLALEIKSACLSSKFQSSNGDSKVTYTATVTQ